MLRIDLSKDFDKVSWIYLWMLLTHLDFPLVFIRWIMCCITLVSFAILINRSTSHTFWAEIGLRQGFPLSPLLFLLVMEVLSRRVASKKAIGNLKGLKITYQCSLSHLLFVDDILILLDGSIQDIITFTTILRLFS